MRTIIIYALLGPKTLNDQKENYLTQTRFKPWTEVYVPMKSLSVRDLKSISELEKLWYEKRDTSEKMTDDNIVDVYCKIRSVPNAGTRIHQIYFMEVLGIGLR